MDKRLALEQEIPSLVEKRAVRQVPPAKQFLGFLSSFFHTPKKAVGEWRPIINLKPLNKFVRPKRFRMETPNNSRCVTNTSLGNVIRPKGCVSTCSHPPSALPIPTIPVSGAHLRVHCSSLRSIDLAKSVYQGCAGSCITSPAREHNDFYVSRRLVDSGKIKKRDCSEFEGHLYVDEESRLPHQREKVPTSPIPGNYLPGSGHRSTQRHSCPTRERIASLRKCVKQFLSTQAAPARAWLKLLGYMASLVDLVPWCRLRMRPLQMHLLAHYRPKTDPISLLVPIDKVIYMYPHLWWWLREQNIRCGQSFPRGILRS